MIKKGYLIIQKGLCFKSSRRYLCLVSERMYITTKQKRGKKVPAKF